ncbi:Helix-turn-helix domain-containing protein [Rhizobiales bacterium GAS113]|nr:Helix-turn-helix domain-containing protein [Rhizobiales bacterium GAS113]
MSDVHPLRQWRADTGAKIAELARQAGVVPSHISQIETGRREPSLALASKLSGLTKIPLDKFVRPKEAAE